MYSTEVMNVVRTLNRLEQEHRRLPAGKAAAARVKEQQSATRALLPTAVLAIHDRFAARGKPSVVALAGSNCSACHLKLPSGELGELRVPGRFSICPNCNAFVWSGEPPPPEVAAPAKKPTREKACV